MFNELFQKQKWDVLSTCAACATCWPLRIKRFRRFGLLDVCLAVSGSKKTIFYSSQMLQAS